MRRRDGPWWLNAAPTNRPDASRHRGPGVRSATQGAHRGARPAHSAQARQRDIEPPYAKLETRLGWTRYRFLRASVGPGNLSRDGSLGPHLPGLEIFRLLFGESLEPSTHCGQLE